MKVGQTGPTDGTYVSHRWDTYGTPVLVYLRFLLGVHEERIGVGDV
jgi:hypothetical protein